MNTCAGRELRHLLLAALLALPLELSSQITARDYAQRREALAARLPDAVVVVLGYLVFKSQKRRPTLGLEGLLGEIGEVKVALNPAGKIFVHGEYWNAEGDGEVGAGEKVRVVGVEGMTLKVQRLSEHRGES